MKRFQKSFGVSLIMLCMALMLSACSMQNVMKDTSTDEKDAQQEETPEAKDEQDQEEEGEAEEEAELKEEKETEESKSNSGAPVLGQDDIDGYEGYTYLYCEKLRTQSEKNEATGKMESSELSVFIPEDEYVWVDMESASGEKLGVSFKVELNPIIRSDAEDYTMSENLDYLLEYEFDPFYTEEYKDVVISDAELLDEHTARATVEYCEYDSYDDSCSPVFCTYLLKELDESRTVYVSLSIDGTEVTGKTPELLAEMEQFYELDINWDQERADQKLEAYLASGGDNSFSTGYLLFELPDGWKRDNEMGDYSSYVYAPGGNASAAGCFISFQEDYLGYGIMSGFDPERDSDMLLEVVETYLEQEELSGEVSYYGETCLGPAVLTVLSMDAGEYGSSVFHIYWIFDDSNMYRISAVALGDSEENPFVIVEDILENGQVAE